LYWPMRRSWRRIGFIWRVWPRAVLVCGS